MAIAPERPARGSPRTARFQPPPTQVVATPPSVTPSPSRPVAAAPGCRRGRSPPRRSRHSSTARGSSVRRRPRYPVARKTAAGTRVISPPTTAAPLAAAPLTAAPLTAASSSPPLRSPPPREFRRAHRSHRDARAPLAPAAPVPAALAAPSPAVANSGAGAGDPARGRRRRLARPPAAASAAPGTSPLAPSAHATFTPPTTATSAGTMKTGAADALSSAPALAPRRPAAASADAQTDDAQTNRRRARRNRHRGQISARRPAPSKRLRPRFSSKTSQRVSAHPRPPICGRNAEVGADSSGDARRTHPHRGCGAASGAVVRAAAALPAHAEVLGRGHSAHELEVRRGAARQLRGERRRRRRGCRARSLPTASRWSRRISRISLPRPPRSTRFWPRFRRPRRSRPRRARLAHAAEDPPLRARR